MTGVGSGGQIDSIWSSLPHRCSPTEVVLDSTKIIGTDHEYISAEYVVQFPARTRNHCSGVRPVIQTPSTPRMVDQATLMQLARDCTGPRLPTRVSVPSDIKKLGWREGVSSWQTHFGAETALSVQI